MAILYADRVVGVLIVKSLDGAYDQNYSVYRDN